MQKATLKDQTHGLLYVAEKAQRIHNIIMPYFLNEAAVNTLSVHVAIDKFCVVLQAWAKYLFLYMLSG